MVASAIRWALLHELRGAEEPELEALIRQMSPVDLLLIEGFKRHVHPKLEIVRPSLGKPLLHPDDPMIRALCAVEPLPDAMRAAVTLPIYAVEDIAGIADFVLANAAPIAGDRA
jgi:molybdopterin-guanine dinucleotide biosynthesis protein B